MRMYSTIRSHRASLLSAPTGKPRNCSGVASRAGACLRHLRVKSRRATRQGEREAGAGQAAGCGDHASGRSFRKGAGSGTITICATCYTTSFPAALAAAATRTIPGCPPGDKSRHGSSRQVPRPAPMEELEPGRPRSPPSRNCRSISRTRWSRSRARTATPSVRVAALKKVIAPAVDRRHRPCRRRRARERAGGRAAGRSRLWRVRGHRPGREPGGAGRADRPEAPRVGGPAARRTRRWPGRALDAAAGSGRASARWPGSAHACRPARGARRGSRTRRRLAAVAVRGDYKDVATAAVERLTSRELPRPGGQAGEEQDGRQAGAGAACARSTRRPRKRRGRPRRRRRPCRQPRRSSGRRRRSRRADAVRAARGAGRTRALDEGEAALTETERAGRRSTCRRATRSRPVRGRGAPRSAAALEQHLAEGAERARLAQANAEAVAARQALCETVDTIAGDDTPARIDEARAAWTALPECPDAGRGAPVGAALRGCLPRRGRRGTGRSLALRARREKAARLCADARAVGRERRVSPGAQRGAGAAAGVARADGVGVRRRGAGGAVRGADERLRGARGRGARAARARAAGEPRAAAGAVRASSKRPRPRPTSR